MADAVLPLSITMLVGPQIITALLLTTAEHVVKPSLAFIAGVAAATTAGTLVAYGIARLFGIGGSGAAGSSSAGNALETGIIVLLILAALKTFINRKKITLPKWMSKIETASPGTAFKFGLLLVLLMPSDIAIMLTAGIHRAGQSSMAIDFVPFIALTAFFAALPLLAYLLFHKQAVKIMPKVRDWMDANSWVVSIAAYLIFIVLLWE